MIVHHISKQPEDMPRINLLLIKKAGKFHYAWIKDLNRLLRDQSKHKERKHFCERRLHGYTREDLLEAHKPECRGIGQTAVRVEMLEEGKNAQAFQNRHKQMPAPYIIYAEAGLGGSVGCAVRLETRRSRVQPPPRSATFFHGD